VLAIISLRSVSLPTALLACWIHISVRFHLPSLVNL
jgi:hypothetical protein